MTLPRICIRALAPATALCLASAAWASDAWITVRLDASRVRIVPTPAGAVVVVDGADPSRFVYPGADGAPRIPRRLVRVALPPGTAVAGIDVDASPPVTVARGVVPARVRVRPVGGPGRSGESGRRPSSASDPRPAPDGAPATLLGVGTWHGVRIATLLVDPIVTEGDVVSVRPVVRVRVRTRPDADASPVPPRRPIRASRATARAIDAALRGVLDDDAALAAAAPVRVDETGGPFAPTPAPSTEGSPVDAVIVAPDSLVGVWQRLADWRTAEGIATVVVAMGSVLASSRPGADDAETLRQYLADAYVRWGTRYVLLAGDSDGVPVRYAWSAYYYGGDEIPTDLYYAGIDGTWNADGDARFGEVPEDAPDLWAELLVGRLPAENAAEATAMIDKVIQAEVPADPAHSGRALLLGEVLFPSPWNPGDPIQFDGANYAELIHVTSLASTGFDIVRMYENYPPYPGSVPETRAAVLDSLDAGFGWVLHYGHGYRFNMHVGDGNVLIADADAMRNTGRPMHLYMVNCTAAAFDFDCLAEHLLQNPVGGAASVIGATNSAFANISTRYAEEYARLEFTLGVRRLGDAFAGSRLPQTPAAEFSDNAETWTHYIYTLLGDPMQTILAAPAGTLSVAVPDTIPAGHAVVGVSVLRAGVPVDSAVVCLWKDGEAYAVGTTDASGHVDLAIDVPTAGTVDVVATARDAARRSASIAVRGATGPMLAVTASSVEDTLGPGIVGTGDGVLDAGETVDLRATLTNTGALALGAATATLRCTSPWVTITDSVAALGPIAPGAAAATLDAWRVAVDATAPDDAVAPFTVLVTDTLRATFALRIHAPRVERVALVVDDSPGNGNGVVEAGEPYRLVVRLRNTGTGADVGLVGALQALDPEVTVLEGVSAWAALPAAGEANAAAGFLVVESDVSSPHRMIVTIVDFAGRAWIDTVEARAPSPPGTPSFDPSLGPDRLRVTWPASASPDVAGYHVYRASTSGGPFTRVTVVPTRHAFFVDTGLAPSTRYWYTVAAVDSSGNESATSAAASGSTNPPQATGWPLVLANPSASSPALGDIDGDGRPEVVVGDDYVYAWHGDGTEVRDGDGVGLTWGPLNATAGAFIAPPALVQLDGAPGLEIVVADYDGPAVYCLRGDGSVLPGWPRPTQDAVRAAPAAGDLDHDGLPEIVVVDQNGWLYAWHGDGTEVADGDGDPSTDGVLRRFPDTPWWQVQAPALADLDGDGRDEILVGTQDSTFYVLDGTTGADEPGWPRPLGSFAGGGVAVGDIDGDGDLEVVVPSRSSEVYALHHDDTVLWLRYLPQNLFFNPSPALADLDGDGTLETLLPSSNGRLYAIDAAGQDVPGWPVTYSTTFYTESSPVVADLDGDGGPDVVLGDESGRVGAWNAAGSMLDGFPLVVRDAVRGTPAAADLDGDGDVELVLAGYDRNVWTWDFSVPWNPGASPWPMFHADVRHSALLPPATPTAVTGAVPVATRLDPARPNPFNPVTTIGFAVGAGPPRRIRLEVFSVRGERVATLVDATLRAGTYRRTWDGRDRHGAPVGSGVYFYRLLDPLAPGPVTRKLVLVK